MDVLRAPAAPGRRGIGYSVAVLGPVVLTLALVPFRADLQVLTVAFGFLAIVVVAAGIGRLGPAVASSVVGFLLLNFAFIPPYGTFAIHRGQDVVGLFAFLGLAVLVSFLFSRAAERAETAEAREREVRSLLELSRALVRRGPGDETYRDLLEGVADRFGFTAAALYVQEAASGLTLRVVVGAETTPSPTWDPTVPGRPSERLPLTVGDRTLGLVVLEGERGPLDEAEGRVLRAFCDQFALALERDRLLRVATEAEVLRQTEAARRGVLAAVSHDLRTPLAAIKASVTDLLDPDVERAAADQRAVLATIDEETDRLDAFVANLLDMSRIEMGVLRARPGTVDLAERVTLAADGAIRRWPGVRVTTSLDERHATVRADPVFLDRVLANLLDNAAKATPDGHDIRVRTTGDDDRVIVSVHDDGPGIPAAAREQLFYPFYRLEGRSPQLGSGLGLAIAKGFVELMEGDVWLDPPGQEGTTISFSLPAVAP